MGVVILPILIGLIVFGGFIAKQINEKLSLSLGTPNTPYAKLIATVLWSALFLPLAILSFYLLDANFPSGANMFGNDRSPFLFCLAPIIFGFAIHFAKNISLFILKKFQ